MVTEKVSEEVFVDCDAALESMEDFFAPNANMNIHSTTDSPSIANSLELALNPILNHTENISTSYISTSRYFYGDNMTVMYNFSDLDPVAKAVIPMSSGQKAFVVTANALIALTVTVVNVPVLAVWLAGSRWAHTPTSAVIINLFIFDLFVAGGCYLRIGVLLSPAMANNKYACLSHFCFLIYGGIGTQVALFLAIIDRYVAIAHPLRYSSLVSYKAVMMAVSIMHVYVGVFAFYPLLPGFSAWTLNQKRCTFSLVLTRVYITTLLCSLLTFAILSLTLYAHVLIIARRHLAKIVAVSALVPALKNEIGRSENRPEKTRNQDNSGKDAVAPFICHEAMVIAGKVSTMPREIGSAHELSNQELRRSVLEAPRADPIHNAIKQSMESVGEIASLSFAALNAPFVTSCDDRWCSKVAGSKELSGSPPTVCRRLKGSGDSSKITWQKAPGMTSYDTNRGMTKWQSVCHSLIHRERQLSNGLAPRHTLVEHTKKKRVDENISIICDENDMAKMYGGSSDITSLEQYDEVFSNSHIGSANINPKDQPFSEIATGVRKHENEKNSNKSCHRVLPSIPCSPTHTMSDEQVDLPPQKKLNTENDAFENIFDTSEDITYPPQVPAYVKSDFNPRRENVPIEEGKRSAESERCSATTKRKRLLRDITLSLSFDQMDKTCNAGTISPISTSRRLGEVCTKTEDFEGDGLTISDRSLHHVHAITNRPQGDLSIVSERTLVEVPTITQRSLDMPSNSSRNVSQTVDTNHSPSGTASKNQERNTVFRLNTHEESAACKKYKLRQSGIANLMFCFTWFPFIVTQFYMIDHPNANLLPNNIASFLIFVNAILNPFIYVLGNKRLRNDMLSWYRGRQQTLTLSF